MKKVIIYAINFQCVEITITLNIMIFITLSFLFEQNTISVPYYYFQRMKQLSSE